MSVDDLEMLHRAYLALLVDRRIESGSWSPVRVFDSAVDTALQDVAWLKALTFFDEGLILGDLHIVGRGGLGSLLSLGVRCWSEAPPLCVLLLNDRRGQRIDALGRHPAYRWFLAPSYLVLGVNLHAPVELRLLIQRLCDGRGLHRLAPVPRGRIEGLADGGTTC